MHPTVTHELRVSFLGDPQRAVRHKERLIDWLLMNGVESFVEGTLDVDLHQNQEEPPRDYYQELGGDLSPISIYRYCRESLEDLSIKISHTFRGLIDIQVLSMDTSEWMEGWKDSFKPFATDTFYVRPPWAPSLVSIATPSPLVELIIEPGMAFGTGQHATTRLCLELLGKVHKTLPPSASVEKGEPIVLDIGTGTGILAIAAKKLGYNQVKATDIEEDAILATQENARLNNVEINTWMGTFPSEVLENNNCSLVLANILAVVLLRLMPDLQRITAPGGHLILSGILADEMAEIQEKAIENGLSSRKVVTHEGWAAVWLTKNQ